jgi:hypothetical protein
LPPKVKLKKEARENIEELIIEYLKDPDTPKLNLETFAFPYLSYIEVSIK